MINLNDDLAIIINNYAAQNQSLKELAIFSAVYLQYILIIALIIFVSLKIKDRWLVATFAIFSAFFARVFIKTPIIFFFEQARPYVRLPEIGLLIEPNLKEVMQSFPSGHALFFFACAFIVYSKDKKWGSLFFIGAILMGLGRVSTGVHFPLDILGGAMLGVGTAFLLNRFLFNYFNQKILILSEFLNKRFLNKNT